MAITLNNPPGPAAVTVDAAKIQDDTTLLGVTGTLAAADVELGNIFNDTVTESDLVLSGCNIGKVTISNSLEQASTCSLDLSNNRIPADAPNAGLEGLIDDIYIPIVTNSSGATLTLDITGNAEPAGTTITKIEALVSAGCTISYEGQ